MCLSLERTRAGSCYRAGIVRILGPPPCACPPSLQEVQAFRRAHHPVVVRRAGVRRDELRSTCRRLYFRFIDAVSAVV